MAQMCRLSADMVQALPCLLVWNVPLKMQIDESKTERPTELWADAGSVGP